jgi:hypothetical protein
LDKDKRELEKDKQVLKKKTESIKEERKQIEIEKEEIKKKEEQVEKEKKEINEIVKPEEREEKQREIEEKERHILNGKEEIQKRETGLKDKEDELQKDEKKIAEQEKEIEDRRDRLQEEKREIERDELKRDIREEPDKARRVLMEKELELDEREDKLRDKEIDKKIFANKLYYLKIKEYLEGGHYNNEMFMIDASTRKILFKSPVDNICGSRYDIFSNGIVVITHRGSHTQGHRLTILDRDTLEAQRVGEHNIFWRSFVEIREGFIYVIINERGKYYLGRFDTNLRLSAKSSEEISEDTFVSFYDDFIYINRKDKAIIVLNKNDLSLLDVVKP